MSTNEQIVATPPAAGGKPPAAPSAAREASASAALTRPTFIVVALILLACAIGLNAATSVLKLYFKKEPLKLRSDQGLIALPKEMGSWVSYEEPHTVDSDLIHALGTDQYLFRTYVDTSAKSLVTGLPVVTRQEVIDLPKKAPNERGAQMAEWRKKNPNSVINVGITYYTGKVDTVPHVPERCYVADGFQPVDPKVFDWRAGSYADGAPREVSVRFIDFEDQTGRVLQNRCVTYFFHANGQYMEDPNKVRARLQDLSTKYGYFAKVEVMNVLPIRPGAGERDPLKQADRDAAAASVQKFLTAALPDLEKLLPDWNNLPK